MRAPDLDGAELTRLLVAATDEWGNPRSALDLVSGLEPRLPWVDLAAGSDPRVTLKGSSVRVEFKVAVESLEEWPMLDYGVSYGSLAMVQLVATTMRSWVALAVESQASVSQNEQSGLWSGAVSFEVRRLRRLRDEEVTSLQVEQAA